MSEGHWACIAFAALGLFFLQNIFYWKMWFKYREAKAQLKVIYTEAERIQSTGQYRHFAEEIPPAYEVQGRRQIVPWREIE